MCLLLYCCCGCLPFSDGRVESLPVTVMYGVIIVEVLLLVLLHCGGRCRLFGGEYVRCHLLLLLVPQSDNLIADWGQLGAATGIPLLGAFA